MMLTTSVCVPQNNLVVNSSVVFAGFIHKATLLQLSTDLSLFRA